MTTITPEVEAAWAELGAKMKAAKPEREVMWIDKESEGKMNLYKVTVLLNDIPLDMFVVAKHYSHVHMATCMEVVCVSLVEADVAVVDYSDDGD